MKDFKPFDWSRRLKDTRIRIPESPTPKRPKRTGPLPPPLRKVTEVGVMVDISSKPDQYKMEVPKWKLECGHLVSPPSDMYGDRYPARMRCRQCATESTEQKG